MQKKFFHKIFIGKKGVDTSLYKAPIITRKNNSVKFRYLRPYLESAHLRAKKHLTKNQLYALDVLDAILESSATQYRCNMQRGDILFNLDSEVYTEEPFSDKLNSLPLDQITKKIRIDLKEPCYEFGLKIDHLK